MARDRKRKGWLSSWIGGKDDPPGTTYELTVLEGADSGSTFAIDRPQLQIGRRVPGTVNPGGLELNDRSVSSRHAIISWEDGEIAIEHLPSATNATLVNGRKVSRKRLRDGDRIVLGLVVMELRAVHPEPQIEAILSDPYRRVSPSEVATDPVNARAELTLREGIDDLVGERFPLVHRRTSLGRDEDCDIVLDLPAVSRHHAALVWEDEQLVLIHESAVNPTHVNGMQVRDRRRVFQGDEIRLSDRVAFDVKLEASEAPAESPPPPAESPPPPAERMGQGMDEAETRLTSPPSPASAVSRDEEATRVTPLPSSVSGPEPEPRPPSQSQPQAQPELDGEATQITRLEPASDAEEDRAVEISATQIISLDSPGEEESLAEMEAAADETGTDPGSVDPTRMVPSAEPPDSKSFSSDRTELAPTPDVSRYADAEKTIVAPVPTAPGVPPEEPEDAHREAAEAPPEPDADATVIRPSPVSRPEPQPDATPVAEIDEEDPDEAKTMIRPSPFASEPDDAAATIIRPSPNAAPSETVVFEPEDEDDD